ncbi:MAG: DUF3179 domain-containing protein, partial [Pirellulaceae bacterium]|nr:DUF3179 domain-containing protein [Pirellulaceae bacterium]
MSWKTDSGPTVEPVVSSRLAKFVGFIAFFAGMVAAGLYITLFWFWAPDDDYETLIETKRRAQAQAASVAVGGGRSAFNYDNAIIEKSEILRGGPPIDGIPAITKPSFVAAAETRLPDDDRVIGVVEGDQAKAYPLRILTHHEVVNDRIGETPIAVTYCPLCDSSAVFDARIGDREIEFGVSGLLYNSNVLMYDRGSENPSLWSQLKQVAVAGEHVNDRLRMTPFEVSTWKTWREKHPETLVMSTQTGFGRNYNVDPYDGYVDSPILMFPVKPTDQKTRLPAKTLVLGVWTEKGAKAYPVKALRERGEWPDVVGGETITLRGEPSSNSLVVVQSNPSVQWVYGL